MSFALPVMFSSLVLDWMYVIVNTIKQYIMHLTKNNNDHHDNRFSGHTQVKRKNNNQWGVFTSRPFTKGSTVISSSLLAKPNNTSSTACSHSIQIGWEKHILMALPARFLNHCCDPNVCVGRVANEGGSYDFVALCDIEAGEVRHRCIIMFM